MTSELTLMIEKIEILESLTEGWKGEDTYPFFIILNSITLDLFLRLFSKLE